MPQDLAIHAVVPPCTSADVATFAQQWAHRQAVPCDPELVARIMATPAVRLGECWWGEWGWLVPDSPLVRVMGRLHDAPELTAELAAELGDLVDDPRVDDPAAVKAFLAAHVGRRVFVVRE